MKPSTSKVKSNTVQLHTIFTKYSIFITLYLYQCNYKPLISGNNVFLNDFLLLLLLLLSRAARGESVNEKYVCALVAYAPAISRILRLEGGGGGMSASGVKLPYLSTVSALLLFESLR